MANPSPYTIVLVDDHKIVRDGIELLIGKSENFRIVASLDDGQQALDFLKDNPVDVVVTDITMPVLDGLQLTREIKQCCPDTRVLVLSMHADPAHVSEAILAEADGYLLKNTGRRDFLQALERVCNGGTHFDSQIMGAVLEGVRTERRIDENLKDLSPREIEVIKLIGEELTTNEIADKLFISPKTVETHRKNILKKTGLRSSIGLIKFAVINQIIDLE